MGLRTWLPTLDSDMARTEEDSEGNVEVMLIKNKIAIDISTGQEHGRSIVG